MAAGSLELEQRGQVRRLRSLLVTAQGATRSREVLRIDLRAGSGAVGRGEAAPWPAHGTETLAEARGALQRLARSLAGVDEEATAEVELAVAAAGLGPAARWAFDTAWGELCALRSGLSLARQWWPGREVAQELRAGALLTAGDPISAAREAGRCVDEGTRVLKAKVGSQSLRKDVERVCRVRDRIGPEVELRLDANAAWNEDQALAALDALAAAAPSFVEQPLAPGDRAIARLCEKAPVPVALDESVAAAADPSELVDQGAAVWVLKPAALGVATFQALAGVAARVGIDVVPSSLLDGPASVGATLHLAAGLPEPRAACGLDRLCSPAWPVHAGRVTVPCGPGLGELPE